MQSPAETLRRAAQHIFTYGLSRKAFFARDTDKKEKCPACTVGAIIVASGMLEKYKSVFNGSAYRLEEILSSPEVEEPVKLLDSHLRLIYDYKKLPNGCDYMEEPSTSSARIRIFDWSDAVSQTEVIAAMRAAAALHDHPEGKEVQ